MIDKPEVILITGGRDFKDRAYIRQTMETCRPHFADQFVIVQGDAKGVDFICKNWAIENGFPCIGMPACWDFFGNTAGGIRNGWMLKFTKPDLLIAFPGGKGTADMKRKARSAGVTVYEA